MKPSIALFGVVALVFLACTAEESELNSPQDSGLGGTDGSGNAAGWDAAVDSSSGQGGAVPGDGGCIPPNIGGYAGAVRVCDHTPEEGFACPIEGFELCSEGCLEVGQRTLSKCVEGHWKVIKSPSECTGIGDCNGFYAAENVCCGGGAMYCPGTGFCDGTRWWIKGYACVDTGGRCTKPADCCDHKCGLEGLCGNACLTLALNCNEDRECCTKVCNNGECAGEPAVACAPNGTGCTHPIDCCSAICKAGVCSDTDADGSSCKGYAEACWDDANCCQGMHCIYHSCQVN